MLDFRQHTLFVSAEVELNESGVSETQKMIPPDMVESASGFIARGKDTYGPHPVCR